MEEKDFLEESEYLKRTVRAVTECLEDNRKKVENKTGEIVSLKRELLDETQFLKYRLAVIPYLDEYAYLSDQGNSAARLAALYEKMEQAPYFARVDFQQESTGRVQTVYIGPGSVRDPDTRRLLVCDWRAPVCSLFYRYETGPAQFEAPAGVMKGEITRKRQYEIEAGKLLYFFDCGVNITDDILRKTLSGSASAKMKTIVETIQREQDMVIRDLENGLVIVQGAAGSGKTSVALHRVAFLLYQGSSKGMQAGNAVFVSPSALFREYVSGVLPELGEENAVTITFDDIFYGIFRGKYEMETKNSAWEALTGARTEAGRSLRRAGMEFKQSSVFSTLLDRLVDYYERKGIPFCDIQYNGRMVADRFLLRDMLLDSQRRYMPLQKRLDQMERSISERLLEQRKDRLQKLERFVKDQTNHPFEIKEYARLLSIKQTAAVMRQVYSFTRLDYMEMYRRLFQDKALFSRLSKGLPLPENMEGIIKETCMRLEDPVLPYEDGIGLLALRIKAEGCGLFHDIRQVVVDEAQDYGSLSYEILKRLYPEANYTIVGDINQSIEKEADLSLYEEIRRILGKKNAVTVTLNKSYRSTYEISAYSSRFASNGSFGMDFFDRHGEPPEVYTAESEVGLASWLKGKIKSCGEMGAASAALLCKNGAEAAKLYQLLEGKPAPEGKETAALKLSSGAAVMPVYMAKGLEFDAVFVCGVNEDQYHTQDDKQLLYVACTRALHRLCLCCTGIPSRFLSDSQAPEQEQADKSDHHTD